jgi:hypothetical protein
MSRSNDQHPYVFAVIVFLNFVTPHAVSNSWRLDLSYVCGDKFIEISGEATLINSETLNAQQDFVSPLPCTFLFHFGPLFVGDPQIYEGCRSRYDHKHKEDECGNQKKDAKVRNYTL